MSEAVLARPGVRGPRATMAITLPGLALCFLAFALSPHDQLFSPLTFVLAGVALVANLDGRDIDGPIILGGGFVPFILGIGFLGPAPTFVIVALAELGAWAYDRYQLPAFLLNLVGCGGPYLLGAAAVQSVGLRPDNVTFYLMLASVSVATVTANGLLVTTLSGLLHGNSIGTRLRNHLSHAPAIGVSIGVALGAAALYAEEGLLGATLLLVGIPLLRYMTRQVLVAKDHAARISALAADRGRLVAQAVEAEERERRELAESLHDEAVQALLVARQEVVEAGRGATPNFSVATTAIDATINQLRDAIFELHPAVLKAAGLVPALNAVANQLAERAGFAPVIRIEPAAAGLADRLVFSVARELMTNAAKHAGAERLALDLRVRNDQLVLEVTDDGSGFVPSELSDAIRQRHVGLASIRERARAIGASFELEAKPGAGTRARLAIPLSVCHDLAENVESRI